MNIETNEIEKIFIQKQADNQLVTDFTERFTELHRDLQNSFMQNVVGNLEGATNEEFQLAELKYDYFIKSLDSLRDSYLNLETAFSC